MSLTVQDIEDIRASMDMDTILYAIIDAVSEHVRPEDVFEESVLMEWAERYGYVLER